MSTKFEKLKKLLAELFQLDEPELDFGIYRILHAKSGEVTKFLEAELLPQVRAAFAQYQPADKAELKRQLDEAIAQAKALGADVETLPKVKDLRARFAEGVDLDALEGEVFDRLHDFFRRYYHEGDFLARRVYKPGVYAIPYEGQEVYLHWANKDQYYIKSSEQLRDYAFRLRPHDEKRPLRVHFRLVDATEGEHGNVKAAEGKERMFVLADDDCAAIENGELSLRFAYRPARLDDWAEDVRGTKSKPPAQKDLISLATARVLELADAALQPWIDELRRLAPTESDPQRTVLGKHLEKYTKTHKFDYFIHKNLKGFLQRELDFYIKNEVMHLDDIESETAPKVGQYLSKIRVLRRIAGKLIDFLAQLEDFQKKLWLKKKFVVGTSWCVRVGVIPNEFHAEIAANDAQREEWVKLCAIDEIRADTSGPGYTTPLTAAFLAEYSSLVVDTRHFSAEFTARLLNALGDIDAQTDGVLVHSENFQALGMMQARYWKQVECTYIDPPYNTGNDGFAYKDAYQHSSWITMLLERTGASEQLLSAAGTMFVSLDDNESASLTLGMASTSRLRHVTNIIWQKVDSPNDNKVALTPDHEYVLCFSADESLRQLRPLHAPDILEAYREDEATGARSRDRLLKKNGAASLRSDRPTMYYPITGPDGVEVYPLHDDGIEARWSLSQPAVQLLQNAGTLVWKRREVNGTERWEPYTREFAPDVPTRPYPTIWLDVKTMRQAKAQIRALLASETTFQTIKPTQLIESALRLAGLDDGLALDYFAGSGTTGHAVINLNREDGGRRRFLLVEMGDHFDTVLLPRIKKVTFLPEWKDGKPARMATKEEADRGPRIVKVIRLESYEDALNNLTPQRTPDQEATLYSKDADGPDGFREDYLLRYMLDVETRGSPSLLDVRAFLDPTAYRLKVKRPGSDESREVAVDLLETFNWLLGLVVREINAPQSFSAEFQRSKHDRLELKGSLTPDARGPWWFRTVTGTLRSGERVLVLWRKRPGGEKAEGMEQDNLVLDEWVRKVAYSTRDLEFDLIYVNGDNNLPNVRRGDESWKVRLIDEEFHRLMFEGTE